MCQNAQSDCYRGWGRGQIAGGFFLLVYACELLPIVYYIYSQTKQ